MTYISLPTVTVNLIPATETVSTEPQRVLFIGQKTSGGTATALTLVTDIQNDLSEDTLFGERSQLAGMIRAARKMNKITRFDAIPLSDHGSGVPAAGSIAFTGPATEAGTLYITVGSYLNHRYTLPVTAAQTATQLGDALAALIAADTKAPFTASATTGTVTITMANDGTEGNTTGLRVEGTVAGVGVTVTAFASGATNPTITGVFDLIPDFRYQTIVFPGGYDETTFKTAMDARFNVDNDVLDGVLVRTMTNTYANHVTELDSLNSASLVTIPNPLVNDSNWKGPAQLELDYIISAQFAAIRSLRLTPEASIAQYVISNNGALDSFGGPAIASLPYFNTPMPYLPIIPVGKGFTATQVGALKTKGGAVIGNNETGTSALLGDFVTTYKTDVAGNPDDTFKYLNYVDTASTVRELFFRNLKKRFAQSRLTRGDVFANRNIVNQVIMEAYLDFLYGLFSGPDYLLVQGGEDALAYFKKNRSVTLDLALGKATIVMTVPIVTQLRTILVAMKIGFDLGGA